MILFRIIHSKIQIWGEKYTKSQTKLTCSPFRVLVLCTENNLDRCENGWDVHKIPHCYILAALLTLCSVWQSFHTGLYIVISYYVIIVFWYSFFFLIKGRNEFSVMEEKAKILFLQCYLMTACRPIDKNSVFS